jgi:hypothetical protein
MAFKELCPEKFGSGRRIAEVFLGRKNRALLTMHTKILTFSQWKKNIYGNRTAINQPQVREEDV